MTTERIQSVALGSTEGIRKRLRHALKAASMQAFVLGDRLGFHVTPKHYYTANHDIDWLRHHRELWANPLDLSHISWSLDDQLNWLQSIVEARMREVVGLRSYSELCAAGAGPGFGPIESQILHCFIRSQKPRRVVELGAGVSSLCMLEADRLNQADGHQAVRLSCVDPYPWSGVVGVPGLNLVSEHAQAVGYDLFDELQPGDLLFIDSSHAVKVGSEVPRIYLEIIPRLGPGVYIHIHDIYLPYIYAPDVLSSYLAWQESTLLLALLTDNPRLEVLACLSALHHGREAAMCNLLPDYRPLLLSEGLMSSSGLNGHFPSSIYLRSM